MPSSIYSPEVQQAMHGAVDAANGAAATGQPVPFSSPEDCRDLIIYQLLIDRFNNAAQPPKGIWNDNQAIPRLCRLSKNALAW
jgi:hypothetical protein